MSKVLRYYQEEANNAIYNELLEKNKCIVKMFCGTGKSLLMHKCKIVENKNLVVFVFPSLSLIDQFYSDYLMKDNSNSKSKENVLVYLMDREGFGYRVGITNKGYSKDKLKYFELLRKNS
jgi:superfamily II DNA or RNA helicase